MGANDFDAAIMLLLPARTGTLGKAASTPVAAATETGVPLIAWTIDGRRKSPALLPRGSR